jgi:tetratricopeptide (TPR) repeat protein
VTAAAGRFRPVRALLCGGSIGLLIGLGCAGVLSQVEAVPLVQKVTVPLAVAGATALLWWLLAAFRAFLRWFRGWRKLRRVRRERRQEVARAKAHPANRPVHRGGLDDEEPTVPLEDDETVLATRRRPSRRASRSQVAADLEDARQAVERGDFQQGAALLTGVLDADPDHLDARLSRGRVFLDLGDYNRAMSDFVAAEELAPESPEPLVAIGDLHFARKDYVRAIECFDIALSLAPDHAMAWCRRGMSHYHRASYELALPDLLRAEALDRDIPNLRSHVVLAKRKVEDLKRPPPKGKRR